MKRKVDETLLLWKNASERKPLLLDGARQVGKTYAVLSFAEREYDEVIYANFELDPSLSGYFEGSLKPTTILSYLESHAGKPIVAGKTLIFLDEIQVSGKAIESLKYFAELAPEQHVIAAGSLLGVALRQTGTSFPVGKVDECRMAPMDFEEFLWAVGDVVLADLALEHRLTYEPMPDPLHKRLLERYRQYLVVGGMPEAVAAYARTKSLLAVGSIQDRILNDYRSDTGKYAAPSESVKIRACFQTIPVQLAKDNAKFQYKVVQRGGTATIFGGAIDWLDQAGIALRCRRIDSGMVPINARVDLSAFKMYMSDVGLLIRHANMPASVILSPIAVDNDFLGRVAENMVAQTLANRGCPLYYWTNPEGQGEVDFVIQEGERSVPIEVKKGVHTRSVSLNRFMREYACEHAYRLSEKNYGNEGSIRSIPLYAAHLI